MQKAKLDIENDYSICKFKFQHHEFQLINIFNNFLILKSHYSCF